MTNLQIFQWFMLLFFGIGISTNVISQETNSSEPRNQIEFRHDNDFILLTDRYYSSGLFLTYRRDLNYGIFISGKEQLSFEVSQLAFTPTSIEAIALSQIDRPYAGFLGIESGWSLSKADTRIEAKILLGTTGPRSGAGQFQRWYHDNVVLWQTPTWFTEVANKFHVNASVNYLKEWQLNPNPFSVHIALQPSLSAGTKDVYAASEIIASFGRRNQVDSSVAYNNVGSTEREIFFSFRAGLRYVGYNALLQGALIEDRSDFQVDLKPIVFQLGFDFNHRSGKNDYKFAYRLISKETEAMQRHQYLTLGYARSF